MSRLVFGDPDSRLRRNERSALRGPTRLVCRFGGRHIGRLTSRPDGRLDGRMIAWRMAIMIRWMMRGSMPGTMGCHYGYYKHIEKE